MGPDGSRVTRIFTRRIVMSLKAAVIFAILAVASAGLVHPKNKVAKSSAAIESRALDTMEAASRDSKALGEISKLAPLTRNFDPTLLALEQSLILDYCERDTVKAFNKVCSGLGQPAAYEVCSDFSAESEKGKLIFKGSSNSRVCAFFVSAPGYSIDFKCKVADAASPALDNITIDEADNVGGSPKDISSSSPQVSGLENAAVVTFTDSDPDANYECSWSTTAL